MVKAKIRRDRFRAEIFARAVRNAGKMRGFISVEKPKNARTRAKNFSEKQNYFNDIHKMVLFNDLRQKENLIKMKKFLKPGPYDADK